jgi:phosphoribosylglycinamide formyltransferase 1
MSKPLRLTVLISGGGTTLRNLLDHINNHGLPAEIVMVVSSNSKSAGLEIAKNAGIEAKVVTTKEYPDVADFSDRIFALAGTALTDIVVCAGFLKRLQIPADFTNRVINIHPSLIPAYCGHGMYGHHVHEAVIKAGEKQSGCTVHYVDDHYDHGPIIAQRAVPVLEGDTAETLAKRVFEQECELYPEVIRKLAETNLATD